MPPSKEGLIAKAEVPSREAMRLHPFYKGKIQMLPKCPVREWRTSASGTRPGWPPHVGRSSVIPPLSMS